MGAALYCLSAESVERGRRCEVAGSVVEELTGKHSWGCAVRRFAEGDSGWSLDDAVESSPIGPGPGVSPGRQVYNDEPGMTFGEMQSAEPEAIEASRAVATDHDIGAVGKVVELRRGSGVIEIEQAAAYGEQRVSEGARRHVWICGWIDPQHVGTERAEIPGADWTRDHPGEVQHADAACRKLPATAPARRSVAERFVTDEWLRG